MLLTAGYAGQAADGQYTVSSSTTGGVTATRQLVTFTLLTAVLWSLTRFFLTFDSCLNSTISVLMAILPVNVDLLQLSSDCVNVFTTVLERAVVFACRCTYYRPIFMQV